jgi:putative transposase
VAAEVVRGLLLRIDQGSQYLSDHFVNQVRFWGLYPCFAFLEQPQTNGVVERFNRTLKEQTIYGKVFRNIEEVRRAVGKFVEGYNAEWGESRGRSLLYHLTVEFLPANCIACHAKPD